MQSDTPTVAPTLAEKLAAAIADGILNGTLKPGLRLDEIGLAQQHGVSRTPVREALRQLTTSGLIDMRPRKGAVVSKATPAEVESLFVAMAEMEATCARLAAMSMTPVERRRLQARHEAMIALAKARDTGAYSDANVAFHSAIYAGTHNAPGLMRELHVITAVVIGGTSLSGGRATMIGTVVGALVFGTLSNGMNLMNVNSNWQLIFTGAILLGALKLERGLSLDAIARLANGAGYAPAPPDDAEAKVLEAERHARFLPVLVA